MFVALTVIIWLFAPWVLLASGWLFWVWQRCAPTRIARVRIDPHSFHEHLLVIAARLDVRVFANGYFVRPTHTLSRALAGSVFMNVEVFGTVAVCGPRYLVNRLLPRGLVTALCSTTCPHATCPHCKAIGAGAGRVTRRPAQTYVTSDLDVSFVRSGKLTAGGS